MNSYIKRLVKYGLFQAVMFVIALTAISFWLNGNNFYSALLHGGAYGVIGGIINGFLLYKFPVPKYIIDAVRVDIAQDETIRLQSAVVYTSDEKPVGGKLFLTPKRLIFKNHKQSKKPLEFSIELQQINSIQTFKSLKIFTNGLLIILHSNTTHTFLLDRPRQWTKELTSMLTI